MCSALLRGGPATALRCVIAILHQDWISIHSDSAYDSSDSHKINNNSKHNYLFSFFFLYELFSFVVGRDNANCHSILMRCYQRRFIKRGFCWSNSSRHERVDQRTRQRHICILSILKETALGGGCGRQWNGQGSYFWFVFIHDLAQPDTSAWVVRHNSLKWSGAEATDFKPVVCLSSCLPLQNPEGGGIGFTFQMLSMKGRGKVRHIRRGGISFLRVLFPS